jgi:hypothetical protein
LDDERGRRPNASHSPMGSSIQAHSHEPTGVREPTRGSWPPGECAIEVCAIPIHSLAGSVGFQHLFIVFVDSTGKAFYVRGGPGGPHSPPASMVAGVFGTIECHYGRYVKGTVDWNPDALAVTVASGAGVCGTYAQMCREADQINLLSEPYSPVGPNSNSVVRTILHRCGLPARCPGPEFAYPGWGRIL